MVTHVIRGQPFYFRTEYDRIPSFFFQQRPNQNIFFHEHWRSSHQKSYKQNNKRKKNVILEISVKLFTIRESIVH